MYRGLIWGIKNQSKIVREKAGARRKKISIEMIHCSARLQGTCEGADQTNGRLKKRASEYLPKTGIEKKAEYSSVKNCRTTALEYGNRDTENEKKT